MTGPPLPTKRDSDSSQRETASRPEQNERELLEQESSAVSDKLMMKKQRYGPWHKGSDTETDI